MLSKTISANIDFFICNSAESRSLRLWKHGVGGYARVVDRKIQMRSPGDRLGDPGWEHHAVLGKIAVVAIAINDLLAADLHGNGGGSIVRVQCRRHQDAVDGE